MNAQFQRIPRRDKKDLREKCKEMRKTIEWERRDLFKKIRDTKGAFHAKMDTIKDRNVMGLTEAKILRRGGKDTQNYTKKSHDPDNHNGVLAHLEPDILECEVKWALGSITTNKLVEVLELQLRYFKC